MLELTPEERQQADDDAAKISSFLNEMFPEHAEVQRALQKMEAENPSQCPTEGCARGNHGYGRCLNLSGALIGFRKRDGTFLPMKQKPEVTWRDDGKMVHLRPRGEGCE